MTTRLASNQPPPMALGQHTSGIYADMTVDGPEIGTLVIIVDRAKNLPNRKAMGKQNPYCAARLGKEAKKTETDKRGGQTPRWDQELRFVVHDSLDYHNLKLSVFSEDKKTDLVGEAWINLDNVLTPGGGKSDLWQTLNCKGKYAGEIRIELTYYDSRPRPEKKLVAQDEAQLKQSNSDRVKRRPLPPGPGTNSSSSRVPLTPSTIPGPAIPGRARHGPRDLQAPIRANSLPQPDSHQLQQPHQSAYQHENFNTHPSMLPHMTSEPLLPIQHHSEYDDNYNDLRTHSEPVIQPDFLPTLPPTNRQRAVPPQEPHYADLHAVTHAQHRPAMLQSLPHAHSDPGVPQQHDFRPDMAMSQQQTTLYTNPPEPIHDLDYQHSYVQQRHRQSDASQTWSPQDYSHGLQDVSPHHYTQQQHPTPLLHHQQQHQHQQQRPHPQPQQHFHQQDFHQQAPLPPMHSRTMSAQPLVSMSAPTTPQASTPHEQGRTSHSGRPVSRGQQQYISNISPLQSIEQGRFDEYEPPTSGYQPLPRDGSDPDFSPSPLQLSNRQSPYNTPPQRRAPPQSSEQSLHRHSIATPYSAHALRQSPHPLSQEVPRARSPMPELYDQSPSLPSHIAPNEGDRHQAELNRNAITPVVRPRAISPSRQTASDGPKRPDWKPRNTYSIQSPIRAFESSDNSPLSHSRQPRPSNNIPRKSVSPHPSPDNPRTPASVPYGPDSFDVHNPALATQIRDEPPSGPITGWDGREIDPSDHLPVASWAPEPEIKTPSKTYGLGRDRDFGPRSAEAANTRFSRDTLVNVHRKGASADTTPSSTIRARLVKKSHHAAASSHNRSPSVSSGLREHPNYNPVPDPYQQSDRSQSYHGGASAQHKPRHSTGHAYGNAYAHGAPDLPPKIPLDMGYGPDAYGPDALSREIASIDIGAGSRGRVPAPVAYVPVRSHRDRDTFY